MALTNTSTFISDLIKEGADAQSNLYYLEFSKNGESRDILTSLKVRAGDFTPPAFNQTTDPKKYMTMSVDLPKPEIQGDKKLSFTFRVDENYEVYEKLVEWKRFVSISNLGYVNPSLKPDDGLFQLNVYAYIGTSAIGDPDTAFKKIYTFKGCWIKQINGLTFTYDSANPLTVNTEVIFQEYEDPETTLKNVVSR